MRVFSLDAARAQRRLEQRLADEATRDLLTQQAYEQARHALDTLAVWLRAYGPPSGLGIDCYLTLFDSAALEDGMIEMTVELLAVLDELEAADAKKNAGSEAQIERTVTLLELSEKATKRLHLYRRRIGAR